MRDSESLASPLFARVASILDEARHSVVRSVNHFKTFFLAFSDRAPTIGHTERDQLPDDAQKGRTLRDLSANSPESSHVPSLPEQATQTLLEKGLGNETVPEANGGGTFLSPA